MTYPALLLLSLESGRVLRTVIRVSLFGAVLILPAAHIGWQASPMGINIIALFFINAVYQPGRRPRAPGTSRLAEDPGAAGGD